jgi:hypothetical protein
VPEVRSLGQTDGECRLMEWSSDRCERCNHADVCHQQRGDDNRIPIAQPCWWRDCHCSGFFPLPLTDDEVRLLPTDRGPGWWFEPHPEKGFRYASDPYTTGVL